MLPNSRYNLEIFGALGKGRKTSENGNKVNSCAAFTRECVLNMQPVSFASDRV